MILLSIIVPAYNVAPFLEKCINSLLDQDIIKRNYEIIVINDGSTDNCQEIIENIGFQHSNIKLINQGNQGLGEARNTGIRHSNGKYIMFVDSDDYIEKNCLHKLIDTAEHNYLDVLRFNHSEVDEDYKIIPKTNNSKFAVVFKNDIVDGKKYLVERMGWACYVTLYIFKRAFLLRENFFFRTGLYYEDVEWLPRVLMKAKCVSSVNAHVYNYLRRSGSITKSCDHHIKEKLIHDRLQIIASQKAFLKAEDDLNVIRWFKGLNSLAVIGILSSVVRNSPEQKKIILKELQRKQLFPLEMHNFTIKQKMHALLINFNPKLYLFLNKTLNGMINLFCSS